MMIGGTGGPLYSAHSPGSLVKDPIPGVQRSGWEVSMVDLGAGNPHSLCCLGGTVLIASLIVRSMCMSFLRVRWCLRAAYGVLGWRLHCPMVDLSRWSKQMCWWCSFTLLLVGKSVYSVWTWPFSWGMLPNVQCYIPKHYNLNRLECCSVS
jgi:hypothetical protein